MKHGRIAVSVVAYNERDPGGLNRYTDGFLSGLMQSQAEVIAYATSPRLKELYGESVRQVHHQSLAQSNFKGNLLRLAWHQLALPAALRREGASVFYSPMPEGILFPPCSQVITIHDVLPLRFPEVYRRLRYYFGYVLPRIIRSSSAVIVNSEATAEDVRRYYDVEDTPIHVVYPGFDRGTFRPLESELVQRIKAKYQLDSFVLSVGETRPYKNIRGLIEAFARLQVPALRLAIVGKSSKMDPELASLPRARGISDKVRFLGYVPDEDLAALYGGAKAFVFPSLHEGFGFPALEAMACGCPVVASTAASLREVCGDAAEYVNPRSAESIAAGIHRVVMDAGARSLLHDRGLERAETFSYERAACQLLKILANQIV